jgi:deazaflavin-dependent oxidoreductase (nitroreductase family)
MTIANPQVENALRSGFRYLNRFMTMLYRLGLGGMLNLTPTFGGRILILTHIGRRSGKLYRSGLNYAFVNGQLYCTAGFGALSDWYRNIQADPRVEIWLPNGWWAAVAEDVSQDPNRVFILRQVLINSGFAAFAAGVNPYTITDAELEQLFPTYRLIHIRRQTARTGPDGPSDLAWVWPLTAFSLLGLILFTRKNK